MLLQFGSRKCKQCDRRADVRDMVEVETCYPYPVAAYWDSMCRQCAAAYGDFMAATYAQWPEGPRVFVHPV